MTRSATSKTSFMLCDTNNAACPCSARLAREVEHHSRLSDAERRGRLVHDHELRVPEHGLRDRHRLPLTARERGNRLPDRADGRHRETGKRLGCRFLHRFLVQEDAFAQALPPQKHVLHDVQVVTESEILVHGLDAERCGLSGGANPDRLPVPEDLPTFGSMDPGDALDHHRLARSVVADECGHLAGADLQIDIGERLNGPEVLRDAVEAKEGLGAVLGARQSRPF